MQIKDLRQGRPGLWINPRRQMAADAFEGLELTEKDMREAEARLERYAPLLARCFPELQPDGGLIESRLLTAEGLAAYLAREDQVDACGSLFIKGDHALPVAGSVKARGGIYAVLCTAERVALENGILKDVSDDSTNLLGSRARELFGEHVLSVGSTGNLGLSIGVMGAVLGFRVEVHMSREARGWKKKRLRDRGVKVIEHESDYTAACRVARRAAEGDARKHFIDDENSTDLFLGYSVAAIRLERQLRARGLHPDAERPLMLYLPCGVGGAPGGITFGARIIFGDAAHAFFIEPVEAPSMILGMLTRRHADVSIQEAGRNLRTDADGLAVARPSRFVGRMMEPLVSGCMTVNDREVYRYLAALYRTERLEVEPSAAAACCGPRMLFGTSAGSGFLEKQGFAGRAGDAIHVIWTTGGLFVPSSEHCAYRREAARLHGSSFANP